MNTTEIMEGNNSEDLGMGAVRVDGRMESNTIKKMMIRKFGKVDSEDSDTDEGLGLRKSSSRPKACKTRRARRKAFRPYYQLSEGERDVREERERLRVAKLKERMWAKGRIIAPYNTTQFLMADHPEEDVYFSNPADDQDFMSKEFKNDYDVQHLNRLEKMSKEMLLNEYMVIERRNENLEKRLDRVRQKEEKILKPATQNHEIHILIQEEVGKKISGFQAEMERLRMENQRLVAENIEMKKMLNRDSEEISSSESSSSSSSSSSSESSDEECEEKFAEEKEVFEKETNSSEDNGYESNNTK